MLALPPTAAPPMPAHTYLQLRSTSYPTGTRLPNGIRKPRPRPAEAPADATRRLPEGALIRQVVADARGLLWAASSKGVLIWDGSGAWQRMDRADGVPYDDVTCLHLAPNGDLWAGTPQGAWRLRAGRTSYFWGKRWMPGNRVASIWSESESRTWLETDGGYACIEEKPTTLAEKAAHFDRLTQERHNRRGYIGNIHLKMPGDPEGGADFEAAPSDGLWTGYYVAAMSLRYAVTHDPAARRRAKQSMEAMFELERLTGIPGYPARSVATEEEIRAGIRGFNPESAVAVPGETDKAWVRSPVEPGVWCRSDTSSDTMDGHYFAWYLYYTHVADAAEKARIAALVRRATDHIIDNGYVLIGHTGRKTRWGVWAPKYLNDDPEWAEQRGLNSLEILSHLKVAEAVTGDAKYGRAYDELIKDHHYLQNTLLLRRGKLGEWRTLNHSDDQLACIAAYPLMMLEKDPARRRILTQALARTWEDVQGPEQPIRLQRSSFYNFAYGAMTGNPCDIEGALADLREWPWDLVDWTVDNSRRHDVQVRREEGIDDPVQLDRVVSPAERFLKRWNGNPYKAVGGTDGAVEHDGSTWLIAYWLGVYHGYVPR